MTEWELTLAMGILRECKEQRLDFGSTVERVRNEAGLIYDDALNFVRAHWDEVD